MSGEGCKQDFQEWFNNLDREGFQRYLQDGCKLTSEGAGTVQLDAVIDRVATELSHLAEGGMNALESLFIAAMTTEEEFERFLALCRRARGDDETSESGV